jgi:mRNA-degrading endonuclease toxin of MazEF toxin-antitoxin module
MDRGDIYLVSLEPTYGREQQGYRPVVVVTRRRFNLVLGTPTVLPVTTGGRFARTRGFTVSLECAGLKTRGVVRCDQPRAIDLTARQAHATGERVPRPVMDEILARVAALLG